MSRLTKRQRQKLQPDLRRLETYPLEAVLPLIGPDAQPVKLGRVAPLGLASLRLLTF